MQPLIYLDKPMWGIFFWLIQLINCTEESDCTEIVEDYNINNISSSNTSQESCFTESYFADKQQIQFQDGTLISFHQFFDTYMNGIPSDFHFVMSYALNEEDSEFVCEFPFKYQQFVNFVRAHDSTILSDYSTRELTDVMEVSDFLGYRFEHLLVEKIVAESVQLLLKARDHSKQMKKIQRIFSMHYPFDTSSVIKILKEYKFTGINNYNENEWILPYVQNCLRIVDTFGVLNLDILNEIFNVSDRGIGISRFFIAANVYNGSRLNPEIGFLATLALNGISKQKQLRLNYSKLYSNITNLSVARFVLENYHDYEDSETAMWVQNAIKWELDDLVELIGAYRFVDKKWKSNSVCQIL